MQALYHEILLEQRILAKPTALQTVATAAAMAFQHCWNGILHTHTTHLAG